MFISVDTIALLGIEAFPVTLEVDLSRSGIPSFIMVGLAEGAVKESKERVFTALKNSGFKIPPSRITVNLAPADVKKEGSSYDLPLAISLLSACEIIPKESLKGYFFAGELALDGSLRRINGALPMAIKVKEIGAKGFILPLENSKEAAVVEDLRVFGADHIHEIIKHFLGEQELSPTQVDIKEVWERRIYYPVDFKEVKGQQHAKRAIEVAAAGGHNLLFIGPPGSGKTMLAERIPTVLPPLDFDEAIEATKIYSVVGLLSENQPLIVERPFRAPHHTISDAGLIGGGHYPRPGEVSLAHKGVLFLDELPEFKKHVLEVLRQPLEDKKVTISRAKISITFPADFMLVAAMNPCPCGYLGDDKHSCICTPTQIQKYRSKISGPLLDRIDLHVEVPAVAYKDLKKESGFPDSKTMRENILKARDIQNYRYKELPIKTNGELRGKWLNEFCKLDEKEHNFLENAVNKLGLSARAYTRILRISRTIADLSGDEKINISHLAEAINYRSLDRTNIF